MRRLILLAFVLAGTGVASVAAAAPAPEVLARRAGGIVALGVGGASRVIVDGGDPGAPAVSPDGSSFVFACPAASGSTLVLVTGSHTTRIPVANPGGGLWSPNGRLVAFTDGPLVKVWDVRAGTVRVAGTGTLAAGGWSATSRGLLFAGTHGEPWSYVVGERQHRLGAGWLTVGIAAVWSPNGSHVVFLSADRLGHTTAWLSRPDGSHRVALVASGYHDAHLAFAVDGEPTRAWSASGRLVAIAFGPAGRRVRLVVFGANGRHAWRTGIAAARSLIGGWAPRDDRFLALDPSAASSLWLGASGRRRRLVTASAESIAWAAGGRAAYASGSTRSWLVSSAGVVHRIAGSALGWSPNGRLVAVAGPSGTHVLSSVGRFVRGTVPGATTLVAWSRDSRLLLLGDQDGRMVAARVHGGVTAVAGVAFDGSNVGLLRDTTLVSLQDGTVATTRLDGSGRRNLTSSPPWSPVLDSPAAALAPDRSRLTWSARGGLWLAPVDRSADPIRIGSAPIVPPVWSPDSRRLGIVDFDSNAITIVDATTGATVTTAQDPTYVSPAMDRVVVLQPDGSITENAVDGPDRLITPPDTIGPVQEVSWSPDGSQVAIVLAGPLDAAVATSDVWTVDVATATPVQVASGLVGLVRTEWAPDASRLAIAWVDPLARTGRGLVAVPGVAASAIPFSPLLTATDAGQPVIALAWSDDSRRIALVLSFTARPATTTAVIAAADGATLNVTDPAVTPIVADTPSFAPNGRSVLVPAAGLLLDDAGHRVAVDRLHGRPAWLDPTTYVGLASGGRLSLVHLATPLAPIALPPTSAYLALPTPAPAARTLLVGDSTTGALSFLDPDAAAATTATTAAEPIAWPIGWL